MAKPKHNSGGISAGGGKHKGGKKSDVGNVNVLGQSLADALGIGTKGLHRPPLMSADPALEASRQAQIRGLEDLFVDTKHNVHRGRQDKQQSIHDLLQSRNRGRTDIRRTAKRSTKSANITERRGLQDIHLQKARVGQDFAVGLASLFHSNDVTAQQQAEAANAAGVIGGSTEQASAAARAGNLSRDRQSLDISRARNLQDLSTQGQRLRQDTHLQLHQIGQDRTSQMTRLGQDTQHDRHLIGQDWHRQVQDWKTALQRGIREQRIGGVDITQQEIFNARQLNPGAFTRTGKKTGNGNGL